MTTRYKPYPKYKPSGVEWLGDVPEHWEASRLGKYFDERREKVSDKEYEPLSVTMQGIVPRLETAAKTDAGDNRKKVCIGDFVINSRSDRKGSSGVSPLNGSVSLISIVLTPRKVEGAYIHHLLRSQPFQEEFYRYGKGIVADLWSTNYSEMKNILLPIPSIEEQRAIASFLDRETGKIDRMIGKQERMIELLKEKRQAVISHAVTKGLDPNVPMKDSGGYWLGRVPQSWKIGKIGYYGTVQNGTTPSKANPDYWNEKDVPWLSSGAVNQYIITDATEYISKKALRECSLKYLPKGTLVLGMIGQGKTRGMSAITSIEATINQNLAAVVLGKRMVSSYLHYVLQSGYNELREDGRGGNQAALNCEIIGAFKIPVPSINEQETIVEYLKDETSKIDTLMGKAEQAIGLMKERRTALISAAVTGKIDVREAGGE